jgi:hypothetical protein
MKDEGGRMVQMTTNLVICLWLDTSSFILHPSSFRVSPASLPTLEVLA